MNYGQVFINPTTGTAEVRTTDPLDTLRFAQQNNANVMFMVRVCDGCQASILVSSEAFDLCNNCNNAKKNTLCPKLTVHRY